MYETKQSNDKQKNAQRGKTTSQVLGVDRKVVSGHGGGGKPSKQPSKEKRKRKRKHSPPAPSPLR